MPSPTSSSAWPRAVFQAPLLRGLDARGRQELERAGELRRLTAGDALYRSGDKGDALFVVAAGAIALHGQRRGEGEQRLLRTVEAGDSLGEEASIGASWRSDATAAAPAEVAVLPVAMLRRALVRAGGNDIAERFERRLQRRATAELLTTLAFTAELPESDIELLLDAAEHRNVVRGDRVYRQGEPAAQLWLIADGMVQLQSQDDERLRVQAYLTAGDFFGDEEVLQQRPRQLTAVASGGSLLIGIEASVARTVADRNPRLLARLRRISSARGAQQQNVVNKAASNATQHAFKDVYRLQIARSLLVIDLDTCVRCGHCAWTCESLHGVARLVRRGDKIVTPLAEPTQQPSPLLLPNSCQHCENPACMPDCPTGAIGRDPGGEVHIRDALCTGCGACAKGCPWDNIQIVPRPPGAASPPASGGRGFDELAVKCDLCRDYDGPACVKACPTESIFRLNPSEELPELIQLVKPAGRGSAAKLTRQRLSLRPWYLGMALLATALCVVGIEMHARGSWVTWRGPGYALGWLAALSLLLLLAYALPKRFVKLWQRRRSGSLRDVAAAPDDQASAARRNQTRSLVRPQLIAHATLGLLSFAAVFGHSGGRFGASSGGALGWAFIACGVLGMAAGLSYAWVPRRLSRLERVAALPEDLGPARRERVDQLYAAVSGRSEVVKRLFEKVLVPYLRASGGWFRLIVSGRDLRAERKKLRVRIDGMLQGRGAERLAGLDPLIRQVVELRGLDAQRWLTRLLRVWLPAHMLAAVVALCLLLLHLSEVL